MVKMKSLRYITYLFYSYYSKGARQNVAYLSSILGVTFLIYITIMLILVCFKLDNYIPIGLNDSKGLKYLKLTLFMSPAFFFLYFGIKEKKLEELKDKLGYEHYDKEFNHRVLLFVYLTLAFVALMALAFLRKST
jgi:hypothetical protein